MRWVDHVGVFIALRVVDFCNKMPRFVSFKNS